MERGDRPRTDARRRRVAVLMCGCVRGEGEVQGRREGDKGFAWLSARHVENQRKRSERRAKREPAKGEKEKESERERV